VRCVYDGRAALDVIRDYKRSEGALADRQPGSEGPEALPRDQPPRRGSYLWFDDRSFVRQDKQREYEGLRVDLAFASRHDDPEILAEKRVRFEVLKRDWEWEPTGRERAAVGKVVWPKR
jgi:hypothetical protein